MKTKMAQYLNEIVSLVMMLLMATALIAAQLDMGGAGGRAAGAETVIAAPIAID